MSEADPDGHDRLLSQCELDRAKLILLIVFAYLYSELLYLLLNLEDPILKGDELINLSGLVLKRNQ